MYSQINSLPSIHVTALFLLLLTFSTFTIEFYPWKVPISSLDRFIGMVDVVKRFLGMEVSPPSWWVTWLKFDSTEPFSMVNLFVLDAKHQEALLWGIGLIILGIIVLTYDSRRVGRTRSADRRKSSSRDRILGLEQRYFLVVFNGLLLYLTLLCNSCGSS